DINQIDEDDIEEMDIKLNMALLSMRADIYWKRTGKKITIQGLSEFADDIITDYTMPSPSVESNPNDLQNSSSSASVN
nr:hypothetical protein [Tanacetum cinerariifolium]